MVSFKVGNGKKVRFWEDKWLGNNTLQELHPSLFRLSVLKSKPISDFLDGPTTQVQGSTSWNFHFPRNLLDREITKLQGLLHSLEKIRLCSTVEDRRVWLANSSGIFSCKTAFASLRGDNSLPLNYPAKSIWKLRIPIKVKIFIWLLVSDKISVHTNLQKRRPYHYLSPGWCVMCKKDNETIDHLFLTCDFSLRPWGKILQEFGRDWVIPRFATDLLSLGQGFLLQKKEKILWKLAITATFWAIWLERNHRIFEEVVESLESLWDIIKLWVGIWLHYCKDFDSIPFAFIIRDWNTFL